jgi:glycosyltransferase involved in cell wall biosynthesis
VYHSRTTAIVELAPFGHRLHYVRLLAEHLAPAERLLLVSPAVADSSEFTQHLGHLEAEVVVLGADDHATALPEALAVATARGAGHLVVPEADKAVLPVLRALLRGALRWARPCRPRVTLLLMRTALPGGPETATLGMAVKPALVAVLRTLPGVRVRFLTDAFGVVTRRRGFPGLRPVRDPVPPPEPAPTGTAAGPRTRIGVLGVITARKNVPVLVRAAARRPAVDVVLAGRCDPDVRAFLTTDPDATQLRAAGRLDVDDRLLDDAEFDAALRSVDAVAVLHDNDAPSGIVAEACARGIPVVGPDRGWVATVLAATGCGVPARVDDPDAVAAAADRLAADRVTYVRAACSAATSLGVTDFVHGLVGGPDDPE